MLYVSFGCTVRTRTFWCDSMTGAMLFILRSKLLVYYAGSVVNIIQFVLSVFSVKLLCFAQNICM